MSTFSLDEYRKQWPRVGGLLAMGVGATAALTAGKMKRSRLISLLNFGAVLVHQYEEYEDPGFFPGQFNKGMLGSDQPANYPLNPQTALLVNVPIAYTFYLAPVLLSKRKWIGVGPVVFGFLQAIGHGTVFPRRAGDRYSPGFLASAFLHVPLGIAYFRALKEEGGVTGGAIAKGVAYNIVFAAAGVAAPNAILKDKNSPYRFTRQQLGRFAPTESS